MKNVIRILAALLAVLLLAGCADPGSTETQTQPTDPKPAYPTAEAPESLKLLVIGNSFGIDSSHYFCEIAKDAGVKNVTVGVLFIPNCDISTHLGHAQTRDGSYTYHKNDGTGWKLTYKATFFDALLDEQWDYISFQQNTLYSGNPEGFSDLPELVRIVDDNHTNPNAKYIYLMTWAHEQDSTHPAFDIYDRDQMAMFTAITDTVETYVSQTGYFDAIIPAGTAIQNARTSFAGNRLTRDGYHLNYSLGRYIAAMTLYAGITNADISMVDWVTSPDITAEVLAMAKTSVVDAMNCPYDVTPSPHTEGEWIPDN